MVCPIAVAAAGAAATAGSGGTGAAAAVVAVAAGIYSCTAANDKACKRSMSKYFI